MQLLHALVLLITASPTNEKWQPLGLICISLIVQETEKSLVCSLVLCISSENRMLTFFSFFLLNLFIFNLELFLYTLSTLSSINITNFLLVCCLSLTLCIFHHLEVLIFYLPKSVSSSLFSFWVLYKLR